MTKKAADTVNEACNDQLSAGRAGATGSPRTAAGHCWTHWLPLDILPIFVLPACTDNSVTDTDYDEMRVIKTHLLKLDPTQTLQLLPKGRDPFSLRRVSISVHGDANLLTIAVLLTM